MKSRLLCLGLLLLCLVTGCSGTADQEVVVVEIPGVSADEIRLPLARELARLIRERINCDELFISEDGVVCGKIGANV